jgi:hypothetical protein
MLGIQQEDQMDQDDPPSDRPDLRAKPSDDRPATGYRYFPASQLPPGRWNLADLRVRRTSRRSP